MGQSFPGLPQGHFVPSPFIATDLPPLDPSAGFFSLSAWACSAIGAGYFLEALQVCRTLWAAPPQTVSL